MATNPKAPADGAGTIQPFGFDRVFFHPVDTPFVPDDIRDGESIRQWMHDRFYDELSRRTTPMIVVSGPHEERLAAAVARINEMLSVR